MNIQLILTIPMAFGLIAIMPSFYLCSFGEDLNDNCPIDDHFSDTCINDSFKYVDKQAIFINSE